MNWLENGKQIITVHENSAHLYSWSLGITGKEKCSSFHYLEDK